MTTQSLEMYGSLSLFTDLLQGAMFVHSSGATREPSHSRAGTRRPGRGCVPSKPMRKHRAGRQGPRFSVRARRPSRTGTRGTGRRQVTAASAVAAGLGWADMGRPRQVWPGPARGTTAGRRPGLNRSRRALRRSHQMRTAAPRPAAQSRERPSGPPARSNPTDAT